MSCLWHTCARTVESRAIFSLGRIRNYRSECNIQKRLSSEKQRFALFSSRLKQVYRPRSSIFADHLSFSSRNSSISVRKCDPLLAKSHVEGQSCLPEFVPFSVPWSIFNESRFQTSHLNVITTFEPQTTLWWSIWQYFWQIFAPICSLAWGIKRMCFASLEMRHSFMDMLKMVWSSSYLTWFFRTIWFAI